jgi:hypothetical protein
MYGVANTAETATFLEVVTAPAFDVEDIPVGVADKDCVTVPTDKLAPVPLNPIVMLQANVFTLPVAVTGRVDIECIFGSVPTAVVAVLPDIDTVFEVE